MKMPTPHFLGIKNREVSKGKRRMGNHFPRLKAGGPQKGEESVTDDEELAGIQKKRLIFSRAGSTRSRSRTCDTCEGLAAKGRNSCASVSIKARANLRQVLMRQQRVETTDLPLIIKDSPAA